jgi:hypothetical protein
VTIHALSACAGVYQAPELFAQFYDIIYEGIDREQLLHVMLHSKQQLNKAAMQQVVTRQLALLV